MRTHQNQPFVVQREVKSVMVPAGIEVTLKPGQAGYITQALGGSFTLYIDGNLFRLAGEHAEAIGQEVVKAPELSPDATLDDLKRLIWEQMATCYDPEIPINIVELGLVYECEVTEDADGSRAVAIKMTLTAPGCGMGESIADEVCDKVLALPLVGEAHVDIVFDPPWDRSMMSEGAMLTLGL